MSLYEPADGLLGTHVTWHDVEMEMQRVLGTNARFGANRQIRDIGDMKTASMSSPGLDVACLMVTCLSKTDRRACKAELLDRYYASFVKSLKPHQSIPYTRKQLEDSYDLCFPAAIILMLPFILSFSLRLGDVIPENSIDKSAGLIEDLIAVHKSNLRKFPGFFESC